MQEVLTVAGTLAPFVAAATEVLKGYLPDLKSESRNTSVTRTLTTALALSLSVLVYYFQATDYSKQALGLALGEGGIAAGIAMGIWHSLTNVPLLPASRTAPVQESPSKNSEPTVKIIPVA